MALSSGGEEFDLGLNVNLGLDRSIADASTLAQYISDMRRDQEALNDAVSTTQDKMTQLTGEYETQLNLRQQLIEAENQLKSISGMQKEDASSILSSYQQLNSVLSNLSNTMGGMRGLNMANMNSNPAQAAASSVPPTQSSVNITAGGGGGGGVGGGGEGGGGGQNDDDQNNQNSVSKFALNLQRIANLIPNPSGSYATSGLGGQGLSMAPVIASMFGPEAGATAQILQKLIRIGGQVPQEGQLYSGLTGGTGVNAAMGQDLSAQFAAGFGFNPMLNYGQAKQIRMNAAALGYGLNSTLFNQSVAFGENAQSRYNMSPDQSMQMVQNMVVGAGATFAQLNSALANLATTASQTQTSFQGALQTFQSAAAMGSAMGMTGAGATMFGQAAALQFAGMPSMTGDLGAYNLFSSTLGQAMIANAAGINYTQLGAYSAGIGGSGTALGNTAGLLKASHTVIARALANTFGITANMSPAALQQAVLQNEPRLVMLFTQVFGYSQDEVSSPNKIMNQIYSILGTAGGPGNPGTSNPTAAQQLQANQPLLNALGQGGASSVQGALSSVARASTGNFGATGSVSALMEQAAKNAGWNTSQLGFDIGGHFTSMSQFNSDNAAQREMLSMAILNGGATMATGLNGQITGGGGVNDNLLAMLSPKNNPSQLGQLFAQSTVSNAAANAIVELGPNAAAFFKIINNPQALINMINQYSASTGSGKPIR